MDRYGNDVLKKKNDRVIITDNFIATLSIVVCALNIAVMAQSYQLRGTHFYKAAEFVLTELQQINIVSIAGMATLWAGFLGVVMSIVMGFFAMRNNRAVTRVFLLCLLLLAAAEIALGAVLQYNIDTIHNDLYGGSSSLTGSSPSGTPSTAPPTAPTSPTLVSNTIHMGTAFFNTCCAANGWSNENFPNSATILGGIFQSDSSLSLTATDIYTGGYVRYCGDLSSQNLQKLGSFRSCYTDPDLYRKYAFLAQNNKDFICNSLSNSSVNIAGYPVPGSTGLFQISSYLGGVTVIPLVGNDNAPTYGCGGGLDLGFLAAMLIWTEQSLKPSATALIACGSVAVVVIILSVACSFSGAGGKKETVAEAYDRYMAEVGKNSSGGQNGSRPQTTRLDGLPLATIADTNSRASVGSNYSQGGYPAAYMHNPREGSQHSHPSQQQQQQQMYTNPMHELPTSFDIDAKV